MPTSSLNHFINVLMLNYDESIWSPVMTCFCVQSLDPKRGKSRKRGKCGESRKKTGCIVSWLLIHIRRVSASVSEYNYYFFLQA